MSASRENELIRWLAGRLEDVPGELARAVWTRIREAEIDGEWSLVESALRGFDAVAAGGESRDGALDLLAADALLTYAFEASVDPERRGGAERAAALAVRSGPIGEIGRRLLQERAES